MRRCSLIAPARSAPKFLAPRAFPWLALALAASLTSCAAQPAHTGNRLQFLSEQLVALDALAAPPEVERDTWREMKQSLRLMIECELAGLREDDGRAVSIAPRHSAWEPVYPIRVACFYTATI